MAKMSTEQKNTALAVMLRDLANTDIKDIPKRLNQSENNAPQILSDLQETLNEWAELYRDGDLPRPPEECGTLKLAPTRRGRS